MANNEETKSKLAMARDVAICGIGLAVIPVGWLVVGGIGLAVHHFLKNKKTQNENKENA